LGDAFEPGMGYVALSRVRSLAGLKLMNLNEMALKVHPKILQHDHVFKNQSADVVHYLQNISEEERTACHTKTLLERFDGCKPKLPKKERNKIRKKESHLITFDFLKEKLSLESIAEKRGFSVGTILGHLEKLKGLGEINHDLIAYLKESIPTDDFDILSAE